MKDTVYQIITDKFIESLGKKVIPWKKSWSGSAKPVNGISKKDYHGINVFMLLCQGYTSNTWLTFNQAKKLRGNIKKGEKSTPIIYWKMFKLVDKKTGKEKTIPLLRYYNVFNIDQCEGIEHLKNEIDVIDFVPIERCETVIQGMPNKPRIQYKQQRACYSPVADIVNMPRRESFKNEEYYYSVLFHELGHSTGHKTRLNRKELTGLTSFGGA